MEPTGECVREVEPGKGPHEMELLLEVEPAERGSVEAEGDPRRDQQQAGTPDRPWEAGRRALPGSLKSRWARSAVGHAPLRCRTDARRARAGR